MKPSKPARKRRTWTAWAILKPDSQKFSERFPDYYCHTMRTAKYVADPGDKIIRVRITEIRSLQ